MRLSVSSVGGFSTAGPMTSSSSLPVERWLSVSNDRSESTVSPNSSTRTGSLALGGKTSTMPPRREISPGALTVSTRR